MADPGNVDVAIVAALRADAQLKTLMPDGVYFDVAASSKTRYVIVSLEFHDATYTFDGLGYERSLYLVKAVERTTNDANARAAAARIHAVLQDRPLTIAGYAHSLTALTERARDTEVDGVDADARWQHIGGQYEVIVAPLVAAGARA